MNSVAIILTILHGFHATPKECNKLAVALSDLAVDQSFQTDNKIQTNLDTDLFMIRRFRKTCERRK